MKCRRDRAPIEREVERHPGVSIRWEPRGHHFTAVLGLNGRERFVTFSGSVSDSGRALHNQLADVRRTIRQLRGN